MMSKKKKKSKKKKIKVRLEEDIIKELKDNIEDN